MLGAWLNGVGLGEYEALYRKREIDVDVLPDLTEADLRDHPTDARGPSS